MLQGEHRADNSSTVALLRENASVLEKILHANCHLHSKRLLDKNADVSVSGLDSSLNSNSRDASQNV